jgi:hypothetical protein
MPMRFRSARRAMPYLLCIKHSQAPVGAVPSVGASRDASRYRLSARRSLLDDELDELAHLSTNQLALCVKIPYSQPMGALGSYIESDVTQPLSDRLPTLRGVIETRDVHSRQV